MPQKSIKPSELVVIISIVFLLLLIPVGIFLFSAEPTAYRFYEENSAKEIEKQYQRSSQGEKGSFEEDGFIQGELAPSLSQQILSDSENPKRVKRLEKVQVTDKTVFVDREQARLIFKVFAALYLVYLVVLGIWFFTKKKR